ncbi:MAG: DUF5615 family PIN-like protein [Nitrospirota bacterium]|mgnify:CR=1 FL=1
MRLLADEGIDKQIVDYLRKEGHVVSYVAEIEPGISDDVVLEMANKENVLLLTADKDFGELVFRLRRFSRGVVLVRLAGLSSTKKAEIVGSFIKEKHKGQVYTLDKETLQSQGGGNPVRRFF